MTIGKIRDKPRRAGCTKLTEKQASSAASRHELLYSGRVGGARAVFAHCDLSGMDLSGRNLSDADFTGAYLEETNLSGARLDSTCFGGASLIRANLTGASMRRADLRGAQIQGANLIGADLYEADMRREIGTEALSLLAGGHSSGEIGQTDLSDALLASANLERAKMPGVLACRADFSDSTMRHCDLSDGNLSYAKLTGANLERANLRNCDLTGADLAHTVLAGILFFDDARTEGANMTGALTDEIVGRSVAELPGGLQAVLEAHTRWVDSNGREGLPGDLSGVDLRGTRLFAHANLAAIICPGAIFYGLDLRGARLQGAQLEGADLRYARLAGADLRGANLKNAKLANADLRDANLGPLLISNERLLPARLERAD
ncbi:MAG: hypothetical protein RJB62_1031, partial [Pseudomonadota bacterium]